MPNTSHSTKKILITGASGQLGRCLQLALKDVLGLKLHAFDKKTLDITNKVALERLFQKINPDYCINCAAYTNVEKAESDKELAFLINQKATGQLASLCHRFGTTLIYPSTDYVFDGKATKPYSEADTTGPINVYGASKLAGEQAIKKELEKYFIIRTSWLYSEFGHNFYNSMVSKFSNGASLEITTEQIGTPTNAHDLASFIVGLIQKNAHEYGIYHYSNAGEATWYDFAKVIYEHSPKFTEASLGATNHYATFAARPAFSVLSKDKCIKVFGTTVPHWKESLNELMKRHL
jgi:dTDP-4-dehydrorhamnose reductase